MGCTESKESTTGNGHVRDSPSPTTAHSKRNNTNRIAPWNHHGRPRRATATAEQREAYWSSLQKDVAEVLQAMEQPDPGQAPCSEDGSAAAPRLTAGELEYRCLLNRWLRKSPAERRQEEERRSLSASGDPNDQPFPVPAETVERLREYLRQADWQPLVTDFRAGEAPWRLLPADVIKNGLTTPQQQSVLAAREKRRKLHDPARMRRRRLQLARYFLKQYRMKKSTLDVFLQWADVISRSQSELDRLCL